MKLPKTLKICGKRCAVKVKPLEEGDEGCFETSTNTITLSSELPEARFIELLNQEALHAIVDLTGLGQDMPIEVEHVLILAINNYLFDNYEISFKKPRPRSPKRASGATIPTTPEPIL